MIYTSVEQLHRVWRKKNNVWTVIGYVCNHCSRQIQSGTIALRHVNTCKHINTINKETFMPIHRVTKDGETYYRWGDSGKLYRKREDAEQQARAAYASGYKEKDSSSNTKKKGSDGKVCWEGYRYGGSNTDGSDKCIKVRK